MTIFPKVTVLVPSYNHEFYLKQRIESIMLQTYKNFELIVIDDCSTDGSGDLIKSLQSQSGFKYIRNKHNTGSPFAAWEGVLSLAKGEYIWVCESDDFAEPEFLATAINALEANMGAALFYCNSHIVDAAGCRVNNTASYFHSHWKGNRWDSDFVANGKQELVKFQLRAQTVPNMSSAVISTQAFRDAYTPFLKKLKLAGDWLFIGNVMCHGDVVFSNLTLNNFRLHEQTARVRVKLASEWAEYILVVYLLFRNTNQPLRAFVYFMALPARHFIRSVPLMHLVKRIIAISMVNTFKCSVLLVISIILNPRYLQLFLKRKLFSKKI